ncbi:MAG: phosphoadenylyl-sulfate reductase [Kiritimatiellae bacterium]|nr:phosphoadenylyl-sulfate reductase [Kiritimatiellia bacterium]
MRFKTGAATEEELTIPTEIQINEYENLSAYEVISRFISLYHGKVVLASSLGAEDQVLTHMLRQIDPQVEIFTIDTGRLYPETMQLLEETQRRYNFRYKVYQPRQHNVKGSLDENGPDSIYNSIESRRACCNMLKIEPLQRALQGVGAWITGLRREQSTTREAISIVAIDAAHNGIYKVSPLANWSEQNVWDYIQEHDVPYNKLHDQGYPSIGCVTCTRAIKLGEDIRAGRWWWEIPEHKECGLHRPG